MTKQIKSKERVRDQGEVFTNEREVKAMCDLVAQECDRLDSRFLEPACGDGNFLAEILRRKLSRCKQLYKKNPYDYERYSVLAVSSIYGVDILQDNAEECRERLYNIWNNEYEAICKKNCSNETRNTIRFILLHNILCGNALTLMKVDDEQKDTDVPIIFPEWSLLQGTKLKRRDFRLDVLLKANERPEKQKSLLDDDLTQYLSVNPVTGEYMPEPIRIYPAVHYKKIAEAE
jgi:hypothetical protein